MTSWPLATPSTRRSTECSGSTTSVSSPALRKRVTSRHAPQPRVPGGADSANTFTNEDYPGSQQTQVTAINDWGNTVGFYVDSTGASYGFLDEFGP